MPRHGRDRMLNTILRVLSVLPVVVAGGSVALAQKNPYPTKPVRMIVGFAPGGGTDLLARLLAVKLTETLGQPFIIDNRTGAGGTIAGEMMARATPDGYT